MESKKLQSIIEWATSEKVYRYATAVIVIILIIYACVSAKP